MQTWAVQLSDEDAARFEDLRKVESGRIGVHLSRSNLIRLALHDQYKRALTAKAQIDALEQTRKDGMT